MTTAVLRKEIHQIIDIMPEHSLPALKPLLSFIADDYWKPIIEPANAIEIKMADQRMKDYDKDPSSFYSLDDIE